jgi:hypothetical protein
MLRGMIKHVFPVLLLSAAAVFAQKPQATPSDASVKQLLEITRVHQLLDDTMGQMDGMMKQMMQQATQGQPVAPDVQKQIDQKRSEMVAMMREVLDWNKLEPMYVRVYQKSFSQQEVTDLIGMYRTPAGQILLSKMPVVMQNTMGEMQQMIQPIMQRMQKAQQDVAAQIQAEKAKKKG